MSQAQIYPRVPIPPSNPYLQSTLQTFDSPAFGSVRVIEREGQPWFVAKDVCDCLELGNTTKALYGLDDDERFTLTNSEGNLGCKSVSLPWQEGVTSVVSLLYWLCPASRHAPKATPLKIVGRNDFNWLRHSSAYFPADPGPSTSS